jgi:chitinase
MQLSSKMHACSILYALSVFVSQAFADYNASSNSNMAISWGQNSINIREGPGAQERLATYCADVNIGIVIISFVPVLVDVKGMLELNLANQLLRTTDDIQPYPAANTRDDIKECQNKGKTILLSFGGAEATAEQGYKNNSHAESGAEAVWNMFGPSNGSSNATHERPFGDAVVDGFDFDFEVTDEFLKVKHLDTFVKNLSELAKDTSNSKKFYLTAIPECTPKNTLTSLVDVFDMWFVQFYNNEPCNIRSSTSDTAFSQWATWAEGNKTKFFVGLSAGPTAAQPASFAPPGKTLSGFLSKAQSHNSMAGAMLWDASQAWNNSNYHQSVKNALKEGK